MIPLKRNITYFIVGLLFFLNLFRFPITFHGEITDERLYLVFLMEITAMVLFSVVLWGINKWISMFMLLTMVSIFFPHLSRESYFSGIAVVLALIWFYFIFKHVQDTDKLLNAICIIALVNVLFLILQFFDIDPLTEPKGGGRDITAGLLTNQNEASALLAFCFPAFMRKKWVFLTPLLILGMVLTKSSGGVVALACGLIFYFWMYGYKLLPLAICLTGLILYGTLVDQHNSFGVRMEAIWQTLGYYTQHWVFGSGIGHFKVQIGKTFLFSIQDHHWMTLHNEFVQGLFEMGITFPVIVAGYYINIYRRFIDGFTFCRAAILPATALIVISANSMVHFPFHIAPTAILAVTWMAMLEIELKNE